MLAKYYGAIDKSPTLTAVSHTAEFGVKHLMFGCQDCGDCALMDLAYRCPMYRCAKECRNGPCGGSINAMCEKYPTEKECAWVEVYRRLKSSGEIETLRQGYVPPCRRNLAHTSGWANYFLNRDHNAVPVVAATTDAEPKPDTAAPGAPKPAPKPAEVPKA